MSLVVLDLTKVFDTPDHSVLLVGLVSIPRVQQGFRTKV